MVLGDIRKRSGTSKTAATSSGCGRQRKAGSHQRHDRHDADRRYASDSRRESRAARQSPRARPVSSSASRKRRSDRPLVARIDLAARKGDLPGMAAQMIGALGQQHGRVPARARTIGTSTAAGSPRASSGSITRMPGLRSSSLRPKARRRLRHSSRACASARNSASVEAEIAHAPSADLVGPLHRPERPDRPHAEPAVLRPCRAPRDRRTAPAKPAPRAVPRTST